MIYLLLSLVSKLKVLVDQKALLSKLKGSSRAQASNSYYKIQVNVSANLIDLGILV